MRDRIRCMVIDPSRSMHDYDSVKYDDGFSNSEKGFDFIVFEKTPDMVKALNENKGVDCIVTVGKEFDLHPLNTMPYEYRKRWIHMEAYDPQSLGKYIVNVFMNNLWRKNPPGGILFSVFTCTHNTPAWMIDRLYESLRDQTYTNWNWFILDDSDKFSTVEHLESLNDPRITVIRNYTHHGVIGFNKKLAAMAANGDYLVEVDHDDQLTPDCLELIHKAFLRYPEADFCYSDCLELCDGVPVDYGDYFSFGQGTYREEEVLGVKAKVAVTCPSINPKSVRGIYALPNHVRCWKRSFYLSIDGHNPELSVLDDMDILIRTFLKGRIVHIPKVLYLQHEDGRNTMGNNRGNTTQGHRFAEIQRTNWLLYSKYDKEIHERILELGYEDTVWNEEKRCSYVWAEGIDLPAMNFEYDEFEK